MFKFGGRLLFTLLFSLQAFAVSLNTRCEKSSLTGEVTGVNSRTPYTIASVSKLFTTDWAIVALGARFRYRNRVHVTPLGGDLYDVHLEGDHYPYFDRMMFQFLVSELNKLGITRVNNLTYDENFDYTSVVQPTRPSGTSLITEELRRDAQTLNGNLVSIGAKVFALENIRLPRELNISIKDIHPLAKNAFSRAGNTRTYTMPSSEMSRVLKEMNRNSNNFTADRIFEKLSGRQAFNDFLFARVQVPKNEVVFYNGSGYPITTSQGRIYNKASCSAVVELISDLKKAVSQAGLGLQDIMAVAGKDSAGDGDSTLTEHYGNGVTSGAIIAKTGTVGDTIALAGLIMTPERDIFFHTSYAYNNTAQGKDAAYVQIQKWIEGILAANKVEHPLADYRPRTFLPFDQSSFLQAETQKLF